MHDDEERRNLVIREQVISSVYDAVVEVCGRELAANKNNNYFVFEWRRELRQLTEATVTVWDPAAVLLKNYSSRSKLYNVEIRTATAIFQRYKSAEDGVLTIVSDLGVSRRVDSAYQLASVLLLPLIENAATATTMSKHIRVARPSGFICMVTADLMNRINSSAGNNNNNLQLLLPCPNCPVWCKGSKGLWWHLQQQHDQLHNTATETATYQSNRDATAIVVYQGRTTATTAVKTNSSETITNRQPGKPQQQGACSDSESTKEHSNDPWSCVKRGDIDGLKRALTRQQKGCAAPFDCATATDSKGATLLLWAAGGGHLETVRYLVEQCGCSPDTPQRGKRAFAGRTALHWAARKGHVDIVAYLLEHAAVATKVGRQEEGIATRLEAKTADGTTAFCWAAWQAHLPVLRLLHEKGCKVDTVNQFGCNAILWAAQGEGDANTVLWLESVGCPIDTINNSGHGLLHKAAQRGRRELCEWYISKRLFLLLQQEQEANDVVNVLDLLGPDNDGCMPSDLAGMEDHEELAIYLAEQERAMVEAAAEARDDFPDWLKPANSACFFSTQQQQIWQPWAGMFRVRSALSSRLK